MNDIDGGTCKRGISMRRYEMKELTKTKFRNLSNVIRNIIL